MCAARRLHCFDLHAGRKIGPRYIVEAMLGRGSEGEVYRIRETDTGIRRAAKLYYPHRDPAHKAMVHHARKLHTLRHCPIVLQYHHSEKLTVRRQPIIALISELCEGEQLERWIARHRGHRLTPYKALCVLYYLVRGLEVIHTLGEYHADVHSQNILIRPMGVRFDIKLIDFYDWGKPTRYKQRQDVMDCVRLLHELVGGRAHYGKAPAEVRDIVKGLQRQRVLKKFPTITALRKHLEIFDWPRMV
ncbi:MAG: protein kinase [Alphaproteobacteria bacterium]|jgi:hypothetical protein|nr:protein kinase [Alphaproteobacteria bacterium]